MKILTQTHLEENKKIENVSSILEKWNKKAKEGRLSDYQLNTLNSNLYEIDKSININNNNLISKSNYEKLNNFGTFLSSAGIGAATGAAITSGASLATGALIVGGITDPLFGTAVGTILGGIAGTVSILNKTFNASK